VSKANFTGGKKERHKFRHLPSVRGTKDRGGTANSGNWDKLKTQKTPGKDEKVEKKG